MKTSTKIALALILPKIMLVSVLLGTLGMSTVAKTIHSHHFKDHISRFYSDDNHRLDK